MARLTRLTSREEALISIVRDEWRKISLATGPADRGEAQAAIVEAYRVANLEPPRIWIWLGSPFAGRIAARMLSKLSACRRIPCHEQMPPEVYQIFGDQIPNETLKQVRAKIEDQARNVDWAEFMVEVGGEVDALVQDRVEDRVTDLIWGQVGVEVIVHVGRQIGNPFRRPSLDLLPRPEHHASFCFYDFFLRIKRVNGLELLEPLMRAARAAGRWFPFTGACIVTERPSRFVHDEEGRPHCAVGPALLYPEGSKIYAWHGVRIPAWFIEQKHLLTPDMIEAEQNAELRRMMLELFGFDRYIGARGARLIAEDECLGLPRHLFEINLTGERVRVLRVVNGTTEADGRRRQFHLCVPLQCNTPAEAVAWTYGRPFNVYDEAVRT